MENILEIKGLQKTFPGFTLNGVDLFVPAGSIMGLIGENGAGKTTTINLILNATEKDGGSITIFRKDNIQNEKEIKQKIGVVLDECGMPEAFSVFDVEKFLQKLYPNWNHQKYLSYLETFELPSALPIGTFSKGMKVKLNIALALAHEPQLLILDEATSGLDPVMRDDVLDILLGFVQNENNAVLFSSHITSDLEKVADYITFLHQGSIVFCKQKDDLIYHYGLLHCKTSDFEKIDPADMLAFRKQDYEWQVLVADRQCAAKRYGNCVIDPATVDDIMLLYIKGDAK